MCGVQKRLKLRDVFYERPYYTVTLVISWTYIGRPYIFGKSIKFSKNRPELKKQTYFTWFMTMTSTLQISSFAPDLSSKSRWRHETENFSKLTEFDALEKRKYIIYVSTHCVCCRSLVEKYMNWFKTVCNLCTLEMNCCNKSLFKKASLGSKLGQIWNSTQKRFGIRSRMSNLVSKFEFDWIRQSH